MQQDSLSSGEKGKAAGDAYAEYSNADKQANTSEHVWVMQGTGVGMPDSRDAKKYFITKVSAGGGQVEA